MQNINSIRPRLESIDGKDYGAYQSIKGAYAYGKFNLLIEQIPKDPYAPPHTGIYRAQIPYDFTLTPLNFRSSKVKEVAFRDYLARRFYDAGALISKGQRGTGSSGIITIDKPGQAILDRSSVVLNDDYFEIRLFLGLPAYGRDIVSSIAIEMLFEELPLIVETAFSKINITQAKLEQHIFAAEDAVFLRDKLDSIGLVAFIADDSILPRKSGTCDSPLTDETVIGISSPETMRVNIALPHAGSINGLGIPKGVTLIAGGGYHGKSTLLEAIEQGMYNHIPGDGRELCVSNMKTVKVRAYSGRYVEKVDISTFIKNLPIPKDTTSFSTPNSSGSTSQAATIMEAVEMGAEVLLMDEDTCANNFMIRDEKMQKLVKKDDEPITTFIDKVRQFYTQKGISTILVLGGAGDYFQVSDKIIQMNKYVPLDVTEQAHKIDQAFSSRRISEDDGYSITPIDRIPMPGSFDSLSEHHKRRVYTTEIYRIHFGKNIIDLSDVEQLIELTQTKAIGQAIEYLDKYVDEKRTLKQIVDLVMNDIEENGIDILSKNVSGHLSEFRPFELAFAINRLRSFRVKHLN